MKKIPVGNLTAQGGGPVGNHSRPGEVPNPRRGETGGEIGGSNVGSTKKMELGRGTVPLGYHFEQGPAYV